MSSTLVTGGTGFVAGWTISALLNRGLRVRTTVRDLERESSLRRRISTVTDPGDRLTVVEADLMSDDGWAEAVAGCEIVHHVASPLVATKNEAEVIHPAVDGVRRVLRAARDGRVRESYTPRRAELSTTVTHLSRTPSTNPAGPTSTVAR